MKWRRYYQFLLLYYFILLLEGDALDIVSNKVTHAFIDGRIINLSNDQEKNYLKYRSKYGLEIENKEWILFIKFKNFN